ncbi:MAG TPA: DUF371 domain-containing protein [Nitrosopumilaceae archaeon]|nr:DUF371 domain-containing protein [Nitrosopumilaceae archaeon]
MHFEISFNGHKNIRSLHPKTIEITTEPDLTLNGDCIIGVEASCGCNDIPEQMKNLMRNSKSEILFTISVKDVSFKVKGNGHENLILANPHDIVIRKSSFICPRTLAIHCDLASDSIPRQMIKTLQNPDSRGIFSIDIN